MKQEFNKGKVAIYKNQQSPKIQVRLKKDTDWLNAYLISKLFVVNRPAIFKHINNNHKTGELNQNSNCSISEQVAANRKIRKMNLYNLDMMTSAVYRINSKQATPFHIWAIKILKEHLVKRYKLYEKRLLQSKTQLKKLHTAIEFFRKKIN